MKESFCVAFVSLGCAKNLVDTEVMRGVLQEAGHRLVDAPEDAEIVVVNTCGFIESAKQESIDELFDAATLKESHGLRWVIAAGCLSQRYSEDLLRSMPEVDAFLGSSDYPAIAEVISRLSAGERAFARVGAPENYLQNASMPRLQATLPATAYLKIADGCDNRCSYCAIPLIRGAYRSRTMEDILSEAERLLSQGVKEICLIAQDSSRYGLDRYGRLMLADLCSRLLRFDQLKWLRVLYCYPTRVTTELLELMGADERFCAYLDLPLQHSEDGILRRMNRQGSKEEIVRLLEEARRLVPRIVLRTSLIVGFPGETEAEVVDLAEFVRTMGFDHLGVFTYSQEEDTPAAGFSGQIDERTKAARRDRLMLLQQEIVAANQKRWVGRELSVLVEKVLPDGMRLGRFYGQAPDVDGLVLLQRSDAAVGDFALARITASEGYDLVGEALQ